MKHKGIFRKVFFSYLLATVIPFLFLTVSIVSRTNAYHAQTMTDSVNAALQRAVTVLDGRLSECRAIAYQLGNTTLLFTEAQKDSTRVQAVNEMKGMLAGTLFSDSISLWHADSTTVYTNKGIMSREVCLQTLLQTDLDSDAFFRAVWEKENDFFLPTKVERVLYVVPCRSIVKKDIVAVFSIPCKQVLQLTEDVYQGSFVLWTDQHGQMLYGKMPEDSERTADGRQLCVHAGGKDTSYRSFTATSERYTFEILVPEKAFTLPDGKILPVLLMSFCLLILCIAICARLANLNVRPIRKIGQIVGQEEKTYSSWEGLHQDISKTVQERKTYYNLLQQQKTQIREYQLLHLLYSNEEVQPENVWYEQLGINPEQSQVCVICLKPDVPYANMQWQTMVFENCEAKGFTAAPVELSHDGMIALICFFASAQEAQGIRTYCMTLNRSCGGTLRLGVGRTVENLQGVRTSFLQAAAALQALESEGTPAPCMSFFDEMLQPQETDSDVSELIIYLEMALKQEDLELAVATLDRMLYGIAYASEARKHYICYSILERMMPLISRPEEEDRAARLYQSLTEEINLTHIEEFHYKLKDYIKRYCTREKNDNTPENNELRNEILHFVRDNYTAYNMSLELLSSHFGYSTSYWSRFFKDVIGENFADCLWSLRLKKARELLQVTALPIDEIAEQVGYSDERSFSRKFKNSQGMTPAQFRKASEPQPVQDGTDDQRKAEKKGDLTSGTLSDL